MASIGIKGATCTGHDGFPPRSSLSGSGLVTVNGAPVLVDGSPFDNHSDGKSSHDGSAMSTRPWITICGTPVVCVGDPVTCGSKVATGDPLVDIS